MDRKQEDHRFADVNALLPEMGIRIITGEADALCFRLLCTVTPEAVSLLGEVLGAELIAHKSVCNDPTVFLTWRIMQDCAILHMAKSWPCVVEVKRCLPQGFVGFLGVKDLEQFKTDHPYFFTSHKIDEKFNVTVDREGIYEQGRSYYVCDRQPHVGFSNVHHFSGAHQ
jgi:hypothetical protein